ncbi:MAG: glycosyltransferase family 4 protein [Planctomycetota bacterium]
MRITFVLPVASLEGGVRVVAEYAHRLSTRGHDVTVVSLGMHPSPPLARRAKDQIKNVLYGNWGALLPQPLPTPGPSHVDALGSMHVRLPHGGPIREHDVPDADVVVATWWQTVPWVAMFPPTKGRKVHFIQHDERVMMATPETRAEAGRVTWQTPDFARVTVASWISDVGRDEYGSESTVVSNAVSRELFDAPQRDLGQPPTVGFMDSRVAFKGADIAAQAVTQMRKALPDLKVVTFGVHDREEGHTPDWASYQRRPAQETIAEIYRSCDAWLFASRCEGFGLPILEAMACRAPVVGTPAGAAPDLVTSDNGRLVAMEDPAAMAEAALEVVTQPADAWRRMSDAAYATANQHDWAAATDAFERFLADVANDP